MEISIARKAVKDALFRLTGYLVAEHHWGSMTLSRIDDTFNVVFCVALSTELGLSARAINLEMTLEQIAHIVLEREKSLHVADIRLSKPKPPSSTSSIG